MNASTLRVLVFVAVVAVLSTCLASARDLTFEERVRAQEAIERVYYSHQIGTTKPFEEAVPRAVLEKKVRTYLKQSAALEQFWHTPVTAEMLRREMERIVRGTRLPDRLKEIYAALGNDPLLVQECVARPTLVERLARDFFVTDQRIHGGARLEAEELRRQIVTGTLNVLHENPHRWVTDIDLASSEAVPRRPVKVPGVMKTGSSPIGKQGIQPDEFKRVRITAPPRVREVGPVTEEREAFVIRIALDERRGHFRLATFSAHKQSWDSWWEATQDSFDGATVGVVAESIPLAKPASLSAEGGASTCIPGDTWDNGILSTPPESRAFHTAVWTGSVMIIWGGEGDQGPDDLSSGGRYDPVTDSWLPTSTQNAPAGRLDHTAVWTGQRMVIWGGSGPSSVFHQTGGRYDPIADRWEPTSTDGAPVGRVKHSGVWTGSAMLIWGGYDFDGLLDSGGSYDPVSDTWIPLSSLNAPSGRWGHTAVWTGSSMLIWGGCRDACGPRPPVGGVNPADGASYNPLTDTWTPMSVLNAPGQRDLYTAVWTGREMVIWGGTAQDRSLGSGGRYDPVQDVWRPTSMVNAPAPRHAHTAVWTGSEMVVWGGSATDNGPGDFPPELSDGAKYDPTTDRWTSMTTVNSPQGRSSQTAVWTGKLMVTWGGKGGFFGPKLNTGGRYDPVADSWTPTSPTNVPLAREGHTAVWTGNQMIVWGGETGTDDPTPSSGGRYDPVLDVWLPTSTTGAPIGRRNHSAIWTGSRMIVWGGRDRYNLFVGTDTGGQYDPVADSWSPTSRFNAPSPRSDHTAIWTGTEMVVWGGHTGDCCGDFLGTGGRYDPLNDAWSPTSMVNAPVARSGHTAVWTGSEMVIWGGAPIYYAFGMNSGGRYDPTTNTWTPTSMLDAPPARARHAAVWTGSLMVVWGGQANISGTGYGVFDAGGRYDPVGDTWSPAKASEIPDLRSSATAIWTGREMIVWGGILSTGGRYDPAADTWMPTSMTDAPEHRSGHSTVWTGDMMIVWGGADTSLPLDTGGRYVPDPIGRPVTPDAGSDRTVECSSPGGTAVMLAGGASSCPAGEALTYTWSGPFSEGDGNASGAAPVVTLPLGSSTLTLNVDDGRGHTATDTMQITVRDTTAPSLICPTVAAAECSSSDGTPVVMAPAEVGDACDSSPAIANSHGPGGADASGLYPFGQTEVTMTARDAAGNEATCGFPVTVRDTTPPRITSTLDPAILWPPNHRMADVQASVASSDACSTPVITLATISSSEPDDLTGSSDGNTANDIQGAAPGTADFAFQLRAERDGNGGGRSYSVTYTAVDGSGNTASTTTLVRVPHDLGLGTEPLLLTARETDRGTLLNWGAVPGAHSYQVMRGDVGHLRELPDSIDLGSVLCISPAAAATDTAGHEDPEVPPPGRVFFYVASYFDGGDSSYGSAAASKPRFSSSGGCD